MGRFVMEMERLRQDLLGLGEETEGVDLAADGPDEERRVLCAALRSIGRENVADALDAYIGTGEPKQIGMRSEEYEALIAAFREEIPSYI
jgi:hypothetical protein